MSDNNKTKQEFILGYNIEVLKTYPDNYFDSIVTDAPYGLGKEPDAMLVLKDWIEKGYHEIKAKGGFMGKSWDSFVPQPIFWKEVFRVLKPGGHVLCFFGTRTYDWGVMAIRLAGFEIRDQLMWVYGSGFPKSHNVSKAVDKSKGMVRDKIENPLAKQQTGQIAGKGLSGSKNKVEFIEPNPVSDEAKQWDGYGTALKPALEPIVMARKPLIGTVVENVLEHGVGGINIDVCRIATLDKIENHSRSAESAISKGKIGDSKQQETHQKDGQKLGRFPANIIFDEQAGALLDKQTGILTSGSVGEGGFVGDGYTAKVFGKYANNTIDPANVYADSGGASRFFYCAKVSQKERNLGCAEAGNKHPTVKPISLMKWLVKLVTPKGGTCLDPFNGSGSTGIACKLEGMNYVGIDFEEESIITSQQRILAWGEDDDENENPNQLKLEF